MGSPGLQEFDIKLIDTVMDFSFKGNLQNKPAHLLPWYALPQRQTANTNIVFGHWAALVGQANHDHVYALDTGCVWGNCLTAMRLEDKQRFSVKCSPRADVSPIE